jgi:hypothetical protein
MDKATLYLSEKELGLICYGLDELKRNKLIDENNYHFFREYLQKAGENIFKW